METSDNAGPKKPDAESIAQIGAELRGAREARGLTLEEVSAELRIGAHHLDALENGRFDALGPSVFAKGYLKQYGAKLGLDVGELVARYDRAAGERSIEIAPSQTIKLRDERQILLWVVAVIALVIIAVTLWFWWTNIDVDAPASTASNTGEIQIRSDSQSVSEAAVAPRIEAAAQPRTQAAAEPRAEVAAEPAVEPAAETVAAPATADADAPTAAGPALEVRFVEDSWAEITDGNGQRLYYALGRAGTSERIPADRKLHLFFGNAPGVELSFEGRSIPIPTSRGRDDIAQFDLDALTD